MNISFATEAGSETRPNEDWAGATTAAAVVLDGVTAPAELGTGCLHSTPWYVHHLGTRLLQLAAPDSSSDLTGILAQAIADVAASHAGTCDLRHPGTPSATVAMVRQAKDSLEYLVLADAFVVLENAQGATAISDERVEQVAAAERDAARSPFDAPGRAGLIQQMVAKQRLYRNKEGGYWVAGTDPEAATQAEVGVHENPRRAALMTDGAAVLAVEYGLTDWTGVLDILETSGPANLIDRVRDTERSDPQGIRWPRYKTSDDATAVFCRFMAI